MSHVPVVLLFAAAFFNFTPRPTLGSDQHMICRNVPRNFAAAETMVGRPGKSGIKGDTGRQGRKGEKGSAGTFDYREIETLIEEKVIRERRNMQSQFERLERELRAVERKAVSLEKKNRDIEQTIAEAESVVFNVNVCDDGVLYRGVCYYAIIHEVSDISYHHRDASCGTRGGRASSIFNKAHQHVVENYIRQNIPQSLSKIWIWLDMTYNPANNFLTAKNGTSAPQTSFDWISGYPKSLSNSKLLLQVESDDTIAQGMYNANNADSATTRGILCQK